MSRCEASPALRKIQIERLAYDLPFFALRMPDPRQQSLGAVVTELLRQALVAKISLTNVGGLPLMPVQPGAGQADLKIVNALRDELQ